MTYDLAVAEGLEPSMTGLTVRRFTNLATPQFLMCFGLWRSSLSASLDGA